MTYADREDAARQEQLDWLAQIHAEEQQQTVLLAQIRQHTALLYLVGIISVVLLAIGGLAWIATALGM